MLLLELLVFLIKLFSVLSGGTVTHYCLIETVRSESFESIAGRLQRAGTAGM